MIKITPEIVGKKIVVVRENTRSNSHATVGGPIGSVGKTATIVRIQDYYDPPKIGITFDDPGVLIMRHGP